MADLTDITIDTSGLICPLPILTVKKRIKPLTSPAIIRIITTDKTSAADFPEFFKLTHLELISTDTDEGRVIFTVAKK